MTGPRFVVLERGPVLWRILDHRYATIDYVAFRARAYAIAVVAEEQEARWPDGLRDAVIQRLARALDRHTAQAPPPPPPPAPEQPIDAAAERRRAEDALAAYAWNAYMGRRT